MKNVVRLDVLNAKHLNKKATLHEGRDPDEIANKLYKLAKKETRNRLRLEKFRFDGLKVRQNATEYSYVTFVE